MDESESVSHSVISDSLRLHGLSMEFSGKNTVVGCHSLLQGIFLTQGYVDSILKSRDITLPTKVRLVKAMIFPVVMYGCESWTVKKAER